MQEVAAALADGASGAAIIELLIRTGWQPGPTMDPNSDHLQGVLDSGRTVPIEIRHSQLGRAS